MYIIGISAFYHDSSVALFRDNILIFACEEEKFTGIKHDSSFPEKALEYIFKQYKITDKNLQAVCYYEDPKLKYERVMSNIKPQWFKNPFYSLKSYLKIRNNVNEIDKKLRKISPNVFYSTHHEAHLYYSFYTSSYDTATALSVDGVGETDTISVGFCDYQGIIYKSVAQYPHSLGLYYSAMTSFLGFKPNEGEYKVMGLAPYGNPKIYIDKFRDIISPSEKGIYKLNMKMFNYHKSDEIMFNSELSNHLGLLPRLPNEELTQQHKDLAASVQFIYEMYFFRLLKELHKQTKCNNLVLSGGCAYNGTANGKISKKTGFKNVWIPSAPSDAGSSIGGCLISYYRGTEKTRLDNTNPFLGPKFTNQYILQILRTYNDKLIYKKLNNYEIVDLVANEISNGKVVAWFEGRLELGARALGHRSIFADPRNPEMKNKINRIVKKREGFRPFAPIVKEESTKTYFEWDKEVPYMNQIVSVKKQFRDKLPAITHIDGTARIQTLKSEDETERVYSLLEKLEEKNGFPIVLNTSFNVKDQTMIMNPQIAIKTFLEIGLDMLILENYVVTKK